MLTPRRLAGTVLGVLVVSLFLSAMIGQHNDGPWGALPAWLGAVSWFTFLASAVVLLALVVAFAAATLRSRRTAR